MAVEQQGPKARSAGVTPSLEVQQVLHGALHLLPEGQTGQEKYELHEVDTLGWVSQWEHLDIE